MSDKTEATTQAKVYAYFGSEEGVKEVTFAELSNELTGYNFAVLPVPVEIEDVKETRRIVMKSASEIFNWMTKGAKKQQRINEASAAIAFAIEGLGVAVTSGIMDAIMDATDKLQVARKALAKAENGSSGSRGNGDRTNPLPAIGQTDIISRGKNGDRMLAIRTDVILAHNQTALEGAWQLFRIDTDGNFQYQHPLGVEDFTSWSSLNGEISARLGLPGESIGVNGLEPIDDVNQRTILTALLRGLPEIPKAKAKGKK